MNTAYRATPVLAGVRFFNQVFTVDPGAANGIAAFSNTGRGVTGR